MATVKVCECCGHPVPDEYAELGLTRTQMRLFKLVEKAGKAGIARYDLMDRMYANDIDGGPESPNIMNVMKTQTNHRLRAHGLVITTSGGHYSNWRLETLAPPSELHALVDEMKRSPRPAPRAESKWAPDPVEDVTPQDVSEALGRAGSL